VQELEETLQAIHGGHVDALVVAGPSGDQVFTLHGAEVPYRVLVESINEGVATLDHDGTVLYANSRFAELLTVPLEKLIGAPIQSHISPSESDKLRALVEQAHQSPVSGDITFKCLEGRRRTVRVSLSPFRESGVETISAIITDVTALIEANEAREKSEEALHMLSGQLLVLQDDERRRISRDLHDVTGQKLAVLNIDLSQMERLNTSKSDSVYQRLLAECKQLSKEVGEEIRTLSYVLHPPLLDELGLASAARWYVEGFARRTGIDVQVDVTPDFTRLPPDAELALFRVVQESLTNIHRYSGSATAQVRLSTQNGQIQLEIEDQGKGIPAENLTAHLGVGIQGMQERMRQLSGRLEVSSSPNGGTKVVATLAASAQLRGASAGREL
jgi:PAS domain S-box-containing protein